MKRGSISVFGALSLLLVASVLFTLLEGARSFQEKRVLQAGTDAALESFFAGYDKSLWTDYRLLMRSVGACQDFLDLSEVRKEFDESAEDFLNPQGNLLFHGSNYLRARCTDISVKSYTLMTDGNGAAFQRAVAFYMSKNIGREAAQSLKDIYDRQKNLKAANVDNSVQDARDGIKKAREDAKAAEQKNKKASGSTKSSGKGRKKISKAGKKKMKEKESEASETPKDNPLDAVVKIKKSGILALVLPKEAEVSDKKVDLTDVVSRRRLERGNTVVDAVSSPSDLFMIQLYYAKHFSDFLSPNEKGGLAYEREYLLGGSSSDEENLKKCINKILVIREAANLATLYTDAARVEEVHSLALLLAGASANPLIIELVAAGIMAAWAFVESIADLRTLMSGGRIAPIKTKEQWTTDVMHLSECIPSDFKATESDLGMCYSDFVNLLLYTEGSGKMAMRGMDIIEIALRAKKGYDHFRLDHLVMDMSIRVEYTYPQVFLSVVSLKNLSGSRFCIQTESSYSYIKAGD